MQQHEKIRELIARLKSQASGPVQDEVMSDAADPALTGARWISITLANEAHSLSIAVADAESKIIEVRIDKFAFRLKDGHSFTDLEFLANFALSAQYKSKITTRRKTFLIFFRQNVALTLTTPDSRLMLEGPEDSTTYVDHTHLQKALHHERDL